VKDEETEMSEKTPRGELKGNPSKVKEMLGEGGEITRLVAKCKPYSSANASQLVVR
jgi:hypothetical protein